MSSADRRLLRHLILAIGIKLVLLTGLWWAFVREVRLDADTDRTATHLIQTTAQGDPP